MCSRAKPRFSLIIDKLELSTIQKDIIKDRYISLVEETRNRASNISILYHTSHLIVTVGSLIVPALMSIQYMTAENQLYWITWVISLLVTTSNGLLTLFKIDKKYLYLHTNTERLTSEGWQYTQLSGRYSGFHTPGKQPSHANQFIFFCHTVEKIRMREIDDEYNRTQDPTSTTSLTKQDPIIPITPLNPLQNTLKLKSILEEAEIENTPIVDGGESTSANKDSSKMSVSIQ
jgi:Protein of unknown function (DUF4231)